MGAIPYLLQPPPATIPGLGQQIADAKAQQAQIAALPAPSIAPVSMVQPSMPALSAPIMPAAAPNQVLTDEAKRNKLLNSGAGVDQIGRHVDALGNVTGDRSAGMSILHGLAKGADIAASIAGSVFLPARGIAMAIPGTTLHHQMLVHQATANLANDQAEQAADTQNQDAQAQVVQRNALAQQEQAKAQALLDPHKAVDPSKTVQTDDGVYQLNPDTGKYDIRVGDRVEKPKPIEEQAYEYAVSQGKSPLDAYNAVYNAKNQKADPLPQQYLDAVSRGDLQQAGLIKRTINDTQTQPKITVLNAAAADRPQATGTWTPGFDENKNPVMFNSKTGEVKSMDSFTKNTATGQKISADEQKRADLAQNMNENINALEDILARRPELFGPMAGRMTQAKVAFGTSDEDAAKLMTIEHQLGMVAQGAHGMRSAQGVESAANSLTNGFKNSPAATKAALESARQSVGTFLSDSQNPGKARGVPETSGGPSVGTVENGYRFKGGDPSKQSNWEKQ